MRIVLLTLLILSLVAFADNTSESNIKMGVTFRALNGLVECTVAYTGIPGSIPKDFPEIKNSDWKITQVEIKSTDNKNKYLDVNIENIANVRIPIKDKKLLPKMLMVYYHLKINSELTQVTLPESTSGTIVGTLKNHIAGFYFNLFNGLAEGDVVYTEKDESPTKEDWIAPSTLGSWNKTVIHTSNKNCFKITIPNTENVSNIESIVKTDYTLAKSIPVFYRVKTNPDIAASLAFKSQLMRMHIDTKTNSGTKAKKRHFFYSDFIKFKKERIILGFSLGTKKVLMNLKIADVFQRQKAEWIIQGEKGYLEWIPKKKTITYGMYQIQNCKVVAKHDFSANTGELKFTASLYKLEIDNSVVKTRTVKINWPKYVKIQDISGNTTW